VEFSIDFTALTTLQAQIRKSPGIVRQELLAAMTEVDGKLEAQMKELMPRHTGMLKGSIIGEEKLKGEFGVEGYVGSPLNYAVPVDLGTRPHFPPVEALIDWVKDKFGISNEKEARGVAFLVARKISRVGTKGQNFSEETLRHMEPEIRAVFGAAQQRIAARIIGAGA
jgi:hypothetical protein